MIPKFRFWDTEENKMHVVDSLYTFKSFGGKDISIATEDIELSEWRSYSDGVLMQYTGLKDYHENKFYDKDIARDIDSEELGVVGYVDGAFVMKFICGDSVSLYDVKDNFEIIGNKYEHPHLLKE